MSHRRRVCDALSRRQRRGGRLLKVMIHGHAERRLVVLLLKVHEVRGRRGLDLLLALLVQSRVAAKEPQRILGEAKAADAADAGGGERVAPRGAVRAPGVVVVMVVEVTVARHHAADAEPPEGHAPPRIVSHRVARQTAKTIAAGADAAEARLRPPRLRGAPHALHDVPEVAFGHLRPHPSRRVPHARVDDGIRRESRHVGARHGNPGGEDEFARAALKLARVEPVRRPGPHEGHAHLRASKHRVHGGVLASPVLVAHRVHRRRGRHSTALASGALLQQPARGPAVRVAPARVRAAGEQRRDDGDGPAAHCEVQRRGAVPFFVCGAARRGAGG
mmetsp:Transcript_3266/g.14211  ORF Transcript_3266/g.14211 Transcript_3266/m.14211 type:complete len:333 (-) Transcript_3266:1178-2176(-)